MKKIFKSIYNFFSKKKVNEEGVEYIDFYETFSQEKIKSILRHIAYNLQKKDQIVPELKLSDLYTFKKAYFAGATLCFDIDVDDKFFGVISITNEDKKVGWFDHTIWEGKPVRRNALSPIEIGIYEDIYKMVKNKL